MTTTALWPILACLAASFITCLLIILTQRWHGKLSLDHDLNGVQKIHETPVPRVGGIGVGTGLVLAGLFSYGLGGETYETAAKLLICAIPVFSAGLIEDFTKRVGVRTRLLAAFCSAALAYWLLGSALTKLDTPALDYLISFSAISLAFTCFAVGGLTNAINIIDGINGLASGTISIMSGALAAVALSQGDILVFKLCAWGAAASLGFLLINYPFGKIFLGDGGAYLAGFWLSECAVLLLSRNPEVSTWTVLLIVLYPTWETVYSIYRRKFKTKSETGSPDQTHMHHLLLRRTSSRSLVQKRPWHAHGKVSFQIWSITLGLALVAVLFQKNLPNTCLAAIAFAFGYHHLYKSLSAPRGSDTKASRNQDELTTI